MIRQKESIQKNHKMAGFILKKFSTLNEHWLINFEVSGEKTYSKWCQAQILQKKKSDNESLFGKII